jgi:hypothetical protein
MKSHVTVSYGWSAVHRALQKCPTVYAFSRNEFRDKPPPPALGFAPLDKFLKRKERAGKYRLFLLPPKD